MSVRAKKNRKKAVFSRQRGPTKEVTPRIIQVPKDQQSQKPVEVTSSKRHSSAQFRRNLPSTSKIRGQLALILMTLFAIVALAAIPLPSALVVFKELLPVLTLVLGFYFGQRVGIQGETNETDRP